MLFKLKFPLGIAIEVREKPLTRRISVDAGAEFRVVKIMSGVVKENKSIVRDEVVIEGVLENGHVWVGHLSLAVFYFIAEPVADEERRATK